MAAEPTASKYDRVIRGSIDPTATVTVDVYSVCDAFGCDHKTAHVVKKLLAPGQRSGGKNRLQDLKEARWTLDRIIADSEAEPADPKES